MSRRSIMPERVGWDEVPASMRYEAAQRLSSLAMTLRPGSDEQAMCFEASLRALGGEPR